MPIQNTKEHSLLAAGHLHSIANWVFTDAADMATVIVSAADLYKVAINADNTLSAPEIYVLTSVSPLVWQKLTLPSSLSAYNATATTGEVKTLAQWFASFLASNAEFQISATIASAKTLEDIPTNGVVLVLNDGAGGSTFYQLSSVPIVESLPNNFDTATGQTLVAIGKNLADKVYADSLPAVTLAAANDYTDTAVSTATAQINDNTTIKIASVRFADRGAVTSYTVVDADDTGKILAFSATGTIAITIPASTDPDPIGDYQYFELVPKAAAANFTITLAGAGGGDTLVGLSTTSAGKRVRVWRIGTEFYVFE